jgi:hypothetical protein
LTSADPPRESTKRLVARANAILSHRFSFFDLRERFLGDPIRWNHEHAVDRPTPMRFSPSIDYRDFRETGDAKVVWEPNRHHHLVVLGRAWRLTGDEKFAQSAVAQIESWIEQCPYGLGMNWRSPLELAIRMINWTWSSPRCDSRSGKLRGNTPGVPPETTI